MPFIVFCFVLFFWTTYPVSYQKCTTEQDEGQGAVFKSIWDCSFPLRKMLLLQRLEVELTKPFIFNNTNSSNLGTLCPDSSLPHLSHRSWRTMLPLKRWCLCQLKQNTSSNVTASLSLATEERERFYFPSWLKTGNEESSLSTGSHFSPSAPSVCLHPHELPLYLQPLHSSLGDLPVGSHLSSTEWAHSWGQETSSTTPRRCAWWGRARPCHNHSQAAAALCSPGSRLSSLQNTAA